MILEINFISHVKYDYTTERSCAEHGCNDGVCHCSLICNPTVTNIDFHNIIQKIYESYFDDSKSSKRNNIINLVLYGIDKQMDYYTIDRILRSYKIWENESWDINIIHGYYGQEVKSITIKEELAKKIENDLNNVFSIENLSGRIKYLLNVEYGYILPELKDREYKLSEIKKSDIIFGSKNHFDKLEKLDYYNDFNYNNIRGIVIKSDDKWRLIDGYHRTFSTNLKWVKVLEAIYSNHHYNHHHI